ncbi:putative 1-phosphatidylinositol-3-phosphate 5-kinase FAB1D [Aegilops tauschii subsp. strangulata]|uniref:1-phosphatidylinositol-3-phosphate 5-kinase n=6 Tax=Aegilops tauschii TaxID=37682 RepID=A0A453DLQ1_AEGTS|nr:putative 1-phosphatidylinositol-3-phosphate 5-kinase FAB1D [Aegilops tauschii subsp. strangulata]XP_045089449.1 putative 1-phosphatidylinositol-3-phosphate 5-kinase FAB1D [Aegilops tauschii subsp. strangulata]
MNNNTLMITTSTSSISREGSVDGKHNRVHFLLPAYQTTVKQPDDSDGAAEFNNPEEGDAVWVPPEPATNDDDTNHLGAHTNDDDDDDDDEWHDGISWGQPSSSDSEPSPSPSPREDRHTGMLKAMDKQLKMLTTRFLASAGISLPHEDDGGESWLDIVTALSWEAALLIKPDGKAGNEMDPGSYIKVKRIASGTRRQCEVINGLVFRKYAAHKHMPTKCHNPKLLLLQGALGDSDVGLSSFDSMGQEKDHLEKAISQVMEKCAPDVILVEKTVSRDIQELLLNQGVTLVLDMKLDRLQRIARCSGSPIVSVLDIMTTTKLKQCDYFHIEKVTEEHNGGEGGKRTLKTLMFLEGFPRPLGCTILLRGANSEELKKVKQVMLYTVFAAYHLVLEASFFEDQKVFLNASNSVGMKEGPSSPVSHAENGVRYSRSVEHISDAEASTAHSANSDALHSPTDGCSSGLTEGASKTIHSNHALPSEKMLVTSVSGSLRGFIDKFRRQNIYLPVTSQETADNQKEGTPELNQDVPSEGLHAVVMTDGPVDSGEYTDSLKDFQKQKDQQMILAGHPTIGKHEQLSVAFENGEQHSTPYSEEKTYIDEADDVLDSQSILILMSSQCIAKQVICEQSHLSRINYYGNFDVSLGRYLQDILQNQNLSCFSCGEPPESHMYSYTHRDGNLTVLVKRLLPEHRLSGESKGKIWMWTRCLRCEQESGISKSSRRVMMSAEARNLSFGKFLELSFSSHSADRRLSVCGHSVNRDCLRFFGLGSKVAMFQYSSVEIYNACKPQQTLEFHNPSTHELFEQQGRNVLARGVTLFTEVENIIQHMKNQFPEVVINCGAFLPVKEFSELDEMLVKEKAEFVDFLMKAADRHGVSRSSVHEILDVNWLYQDLLLGQYVWDRRLHGLLLGKSAGKERMSNSMKKVTIELTYDRTATGAEADGIAEGTSSQLSLENGSIEPVQFGELGVNRHSSAVTDETHQDRHYEKQASAPSRTSDILDAQGQRNGPILQRSISFKQGIQQFRVSEWEDREKWVWSPLSELRLAYRQELQAGCLEKFELVNRYSPSHLPPLYKQSAEEAPSPRFVVGPGGNVLSVSEDEISSIVSCALAISEDRRHLLDSIVESHASDTTSMLSESSSSASSSSWSSESSDSEAGFLSDELYNYDSSLLSSSLHPEISVNGKANLKGKYSVICVHANQFYTLRQKCCPSELAYVASLSRCKKWNAQGGKSKAFFAKTMDGRFIVKQIQKTEFESFIEFAPDYFKHVCHSLDTGSQTCLAKILGIYQVKQIRHGKEVKIDLMVMENLLFGHNVSRIYDLKGAVFSRYIADSSDPHTVYLDQNFVEDMRVSPIYIGGRTKHLLQRAIWNDTSFLTSVNVMDYSLLVGVDEQNHEFVLGIIDYLRQYTWDKQLETWAKTSLVVPKNESPTVISPREYKKRFRKFMAKYFLTVPDDWTTAKKSSGTCKYCARGNCNLSKIDSQKPQLRAESCSIQ